MIRYAGFLMLILALLVGAPGAFAQSDGDVQLRLTNTLADTVDYYRIPTGGKPTFAGSVAPGAVVDVDAEPGEGFVFAVNRVPFQKYVARAEPFQGLTLAPQGQQKPPIVGNAKRAPVAGGAPAAPTQADVAADGLIWSVSQFEDADGVATSVLSFGLPETDAIQVSAACSAALATPSVLLSTDVAQLEDGAAASLRFVAPGFAASYSGRVRHSASSEGQDGVVLAIPVDDPLWQALPRLKAVGYGLAAQKPQPLALANIGAPLARFLADCRQFAGAGSKGGAVGGVITDATKLFADDAIAEAAPDSCATLDGVVSRDGGRAVSVEFVNRTDEYRVLLWIDFAGMPVEYAQLEAGQAFKVETSTTHPWMATDGPGNCIEKFMPVAGRIEITRKSPGFGDE